MVLQGEVFMANEKHHDLRLLLKFEFEKRKAKNPSYSLRAFARTLGMSDSYLSRFLRQKQLVSNAILLRVAQKLNLEKSTIATLKDDLSEKRRIRRHKNEISNLNNF
jgi:transcriptional regulator with XRE-family HTH domain